MFDINKIINDTIAAAVSTHITTLQQEYANKMAEIAEKITALEMRLTLGEKLTPTQGVDTALDDRIAALENQALVEHDAVDARIAALENNPAQGVDTTFNAHITALRQEYANKMGEMAERIAALEDRIAVLAAELIADNPAQGVDTTLNAWEMAMQNRVASADAVAQRMHERVAALETHTAVLDQHGGLLEYLDNQEWFWDKIRNFTDGAVESAIEQHCEEYDHDDYDRVVSALDGVDLGDYITKDNFRDEIEEVLNDATLSIRF